MDTFETIKKFLAEGGKCLLIENGQPIGVVLTIEEYDKIRDKSELKDEETQVAESEVKTEKSKEPTAIYPPAVHPIGEAMAKEMNYPEASADISEINIADADNLTLEDLGLDELPY